MHRFNYQKSQRYFAQTPGSLEELAGAELKTLGATQVKPGFRGVYFKAEPSVLYAVNYNARLLTRVLAPLATFECRNREDLYRAGRSIDWSHIFTLKDTFGIFANVTGNAEIHHSKFASLCLKDAVVDCFRHRFGRRPNVDARQPDLWLNLRIEKTRGIISLDTSGGSLHRRGYRRDTVEAPMQETIAAAVLALAEWDTQKPLYDPMCGAGTLLCEALMKAGRIPAGSLRKRFGFQFLPDFSSTIWRQVKQRSDNASRAIPQGIIAGSDIARDASSAARKNCANIPGGNRIAINRMDFKAITGLENRVIVCNPPYGIRLQPAGGLDRFYRQFGDFLKQRCTGSRAYIYFGNREMIKKIGLRPAWKKPLRNAGLDGRLARFDLY